MHLQSIARVSLKVQIPWDVELSFARFDSSMSLVYPFAVCLYYVAMESISSMRDYSSLSLLLAFIT